MNYIRITKENIDKEHICCAMSGKQSVAKKEWLRQRFDDGLVFYRSEERGKCFIEYIPAENAWVPIEADGYAVCNHNAALADFAGRTVSHRCVWDSVSEIHGTGTQIPRKKISQIRNRQVEFENHNFKVAGEI